MLKIVLVVFALLACAIGFVAIDAQEKKPTIASSNSEQRKTPIWSTSGFAISIENRRIEFKCQTVRDVVPSGWMPCGGADNIKEILFTGGDWSKVLICVDNADPKTKSTKCIIGDAISSLPVKD